MIYFLLTAATLLFAALTYLIGSTETPPAFDLFVSEKMVHLHHPELTKAIILFTNLGNPPWVAGMSLMIAGILWYQKKYRAVHFLLLSVAGAGVLFASIKHTLLRPRPQLQLIDAGGYAFPSGHATMTMAFSLALCLLFLQNTDHKKLLCAVTMLYALGMAASRLYLNVHWCSDIIAGLLLGAGWTLLLYRLFSP